jgi:hypothetical protein
MTWRATSARPCLPNTPKEVSEFMGKIGARIPNVRPGEKSVQYFKELQAWPRA